MSAETITPGMSNTRLEIRLDTEKPIDLTDLAVSFQALAFEYKKFLNQYLREKGESARDKDVNLYITNISSGSIVAELIGQFFPVMEHADIFFNFVKKI